MRGWYPESSSIIQSFTTNCTYLIAHCLQILTFFAMSKKKFILKILLIAEILHHLGCMKPYKQWDKLPINWCRISPISSIHPSWVVHLSMSKALIHHEVLDGCQRARPCIPCWPHPHSLVLRPRNQASTLLNKNNMQENMFVSLISCQFWKFWKYQSEKTNTISKLWETLGYQLQVAFRFGSCIWVF